MASFTRSSLFLFALCLIALAGSGHQPASATKQRPSSAEEDRHLAEHKAKFEKVLNELQEHPKYVEAKQKLDAEAERRRRRVDFLMQGNPKLRKATRSGGVSKEEAEFRAKHDAALKEMMGSEKFQQLRKHFGGDKEDSGRRHSGFSPSPGPTGSLSGEDTADSDSGSIRAARDRRAAGAGGGKPRPVGPAKRLSSSRQIRVTPDKLTAAAK
ncbi:hypothetical protein Efla_002456 [Eimeria flavescens]